MKHYAATNLGCKCDECPLKAQDSTPIIPEINTAAKLIVVAEAPGRTEETTKKFLTGRSGNLFDSMLRKYNISRDKIHITNTLLCRPVYDLSTKDWKTALACCRQRLVDELDQVNTKWICSLGKNALKQLTGKFMISNWAGGPLDGTKEFSIYSLIPTWHPAHCFRPEGVGLSHVIAIHIARAWALATGRLTLWQWPIILTQPNKFALDALLDMQYSMKPLGVDVETAGDPLHALMLSIGVGNQDYSVSMPWDGYGEQPALVTYPGGKKIAQTMKSLLESDIPKVLHNGQHDILALESKEIKLGNYAFDTLLAHAVVAPNQPHKLSHVACVELHCERWKDLFHGGTDSKGEEMFSQSNPEDLRIYNAKDSSATLSLYEPLQNRLLQTYNGQALNDAYLERAKIAINMRRTGMKVDVSVFDTHRKSLRRKKNTAKLEVVKLVQTLGIDKYNINSSKDNNNLFFRVLQAPIVRRSKKTQAPSLDGKSLNSYFTNYNPTLAKISKFLVKYRKCKKLQGDFLDHLPMDRNSIVHPTWNVHGAKTFRWSCQDPNLMNIPTPKERLSKTGKTIQTAPGLRDIFKGFGNNKIVEADYSALELRVIAILALDTELINAFAEGVDVHRLNASRIFKVKPEDVYPTMRLVAKKFVFGSNYGAGPETVWQALSSEEGMPPISFNEVKYIHERWFAIHPLIAEYQRETIKFARKFDYVEAPISQHRIYFSGIVEETKPVNYIIQHTAADIINRAIPHINDELKWPVESICAQVHDSLVVQGPNSRRLINLLQKYMPYDWKNGKRTMHFPVEFKVGASWGRLSKVKV